MNRRHYAITLEQASQEAPILAKLVALTRDSSERLRAVQTLIPVGLHAAIQAGPIEGDSWCLLVKNNAAARHVGVSTEQACAGLSRFKNVKRRMEVKGTVNGITVYDDFAHHPTAIATTVAGLRHRVGAARILAVLEPRSNTMKLGTMKAALPKSLAEADQIFCYAGGVDWDVAAALAPLGSKLHVHHDLAVLVAEIAQQAQPGDQILVMSNGGFGGIHGKLLEAL